MRKQAEKIIWELRELLDTLDEAVDVPDLKNKREQLCGLDKVLQQLDASRLPVPDELKRIKTELIDEVCIADEAEQTLSYLRNEFDVLVQRVGQPTCHEPRLDFTPGTRLREVMLECLRTMGGSGKSKDVVDAMGTRMEGHLRAGDLKKGTDGLPLWRKRARNERGRMVADGVLRKDSPPGTWELS